VLWGDIMVVKEMNIMGAKVTFVDDYIVEHNVTREQSIEVLNRVAERMLLQLNMQLRAKNNGQGEPSE